jgi:hypothetical protein
MDLYKIYCETDGWIEVISESEPTVCPIDGGHSLRAGSATLLQNDVKTNFEGHHTELALSKYKELRYNEIDYRTGELIAQGFVYATKTFSLSENAQTNILALDNTRDDPALSYPIEYNTIDDSDSYSVVDSTDMHSMYLTALATKKAHLDSGTVLKQQIRSAADEAAVNGVIDNR